MARRGNESRFAVTGLMTGAAFVLTGFSQIRVQILDRDNVLKEAEANKASGALSRLIARRGTLVSADGATLAQSMDAAVLSLNYESIPRSPGFFMALAQATGLSENELRRPAELGKKSRVWPGLLNASQAENVQKVKREWDADGVSLERTLFRQYPMGDSFSGLVGTLIEGRPTLGLEKSMNQELAGQNGLQKGFIDRTGTFIALGNAKQERRNGTDITLTIDSELQSAATMAVKAAVESNKARSGSAILYDPTTGDILAMANWPTYDPDKPTAIGQFNPCTMGAYEPGSTFKILTVAKALDDGVVTPGWSSGCSGEIRVADRIIHCSHGSHGHVTLESAIAQSCNVSAARWAMEVGSDRMRRFLEDSGVLEKPGIGMPSEASGRFDYNEYAKKLQTALVGFGQSLGCTPVSLVSAFGSIANDGVQMRPRLIKSMGGIDQPVRTRGKLFSPATAHQVSDMMKSVIDSNRGTGKKLRLPGHSLAGKTGTAEKVGSSNGAYVANFVGFVPAERPKAVVLVMIDSPSAGRYYGGEVAGPVFLDLAKAVVRRYAIPSDTRPGR